MKCNDVAIVSTAALCALGEDLGECVASLRGSTCGVRAADGLEQQPRQHAGVGQVPLSAPPEDSAARAEALLGQALHQLLGGPAFSALGVDKSQCCAVLGTTLAGIRHCGEGLRCEARSEIAAADLEFARMPAGAVLRAALRPYAFEGPAISLSSACASALSAVLHGCAMVQSNQAQCVVAGGYDPISEFSYAGFAALQLVAQGPLSPFAKDREGMKLGEGCALLLLCPLELARQRGLKPLGVIEAGGEASDAYHLTHPHPEGRGAARALKAALNGHLPGLLVAHATGTPGNDDAEHAALCTAFGDRLERVPVSALKSRLGHPLGAAGALELVLALGCIEDGFVPAGVGRAPDRAAFPTLDVVHNLARSIAPQRVTALAAGFGGANVAVTVARNGALPLSAQKEAVRSVIRIAGVGAVTVHGRGVNGLQWDSGERAPDALEGVLTPLLDRARTRRLALLPRLLLAAVRDLMEQHQLAPTDLVDVPLLAATWHGAAEFTELYYRDLLSSGIDLANPMLFAESVPNVGSAHVSMAYGMTAASATVVGTRTSGMEALALALARIRAGHWERALVVAGDEVHPIVSRVLGKCHQGLADGAAGAVALLLERSNAGGISGGNSGGNGRAAGAVVVSVAPAAVPPKGSADGAHVTTASACDRPLHERGFAALNMPGLGSASGPGALALAAALIARGAHSHVHVGCCEPGGKAWIAHTVA